MAGKRQTFESEILSLVFTNTRSIFIGGNLGIRGSATAGNLYIALFTASPGESGAIVNECSYTSYARVAVARNISAWTVTAGEVTNDAAITFPTCTGGSETATHFGICKAGTSGVADLLYYGAFSAGLAISVGVTPQIQAGDLTVTED